MMQRAEGCREGSLERGIGRQRQTEEMTIASLRYVPITMLWLTKCTYCISLYVSTKSIEIVQ